MEHVCAEENTWTFKAQHILRLPWKKLFDCSLVQKPWVNIKKAEFTQTDMEHIWVKYPWHFKIVAPQLIGKVTK